MKRFVPFAMVSFIVILALGVMTTLQRNPELRAKLATEWRKRLEEATEIVDEAIAEATEAGA